MKFHRRNPIRKAPGVKKPGRGDEGNLCNGAVSGFPGLGTVPPVQDLRTVAVFSRSCRTIARCTLLGRMAIFDSSAIWCKLSLSARKKAVNNDGRWRRNRKGQRQQRRKGSNDAKPPKTPKTPEPPKTIVNGPKGTNVSETVPIPPRPPKK